MESCVKATFPSTNFGTTTERNIMAKKVTAQQIIDNINAKIGLIRAQGLGVKHYRDLQELLDDICRHNNGMQSIDIETLNISQGISKYTDGKFTG